MASCLSRLRNCGSATVASLTRLRKCGSATVASQLWLRDCGSATEAPRLWLCNCGLPLDSRDDLLRKLRHICCIVRRRPDQLAQGVLDERLGALAELDERLGALDDLNAAKRSKRQKEDNSKLSKRNKSALTKRLLLLLPPTRLDSTWQNVEGPSRHVANDPKRCQPRHSYPPRPIV